MDWFSYSKQKNAEFGSSIAIRVHHVKSLRVTAPNDSLKPGSHIKQLTLRPTAFQSIIHHRNHTRPDRHAPNGAEHVPVEVNARARHREATLPSVAVHGPRGLLEQLPAVQGGHLVGLQRDSDQTGRHLFDERRGGHGELQQQNRFGARVELDGEVDVASAISEERAGDFSAEGGRDGEMSGPKPFAGWEREKAEEGTEEGGELDLGFGHVVE